MSYTDQEKQVAEAVRKLFDKGSVTTKTLQELQLLLGDNRSILSDDFQNALRTLEQSLQVSRNSFFSEYQAQKAIDAFTSKITEQSPPGFFATIGKVFNRFFSPPDEKTAVQEFETNESIKNILEQSKKGKEDKVIEPDSKGIDPVGKDQRVQQDIPKAPPLPENMSEKPNVGKDYIPPAPPLPEKMEKKPNVEGSIPTPPPPPPLPDNAAEPKKTKDREAPAALSKEINTGIELKKVEPRQKEEKMGEKPNVGKDYIPPAPPLPEKMEKKPNVEGSIPTPPPPPPFPKDPEESKEAKGGAPADLLEQIKAGTKLKKVEPRDKEEQPDIKSKLAEGIKKRRRFIKDDDDDDKDLDENDQVVQQEVAKDQPIPDVSKAPPPPPPFPKDPEESKEAKGGAPAGLLEQIKAGTKLKKVEPRDKEEQPDIKSSMEERAAEIIKHVKKKDDRNLEEDYKTFLDKDEQEQKFYIFDVIKSGDKDNKLEDIQQLISDEGWGVKITKKDIEGIRKNVEAEVKGKGFLEDIIKGGEKDKKADAIIKEGPAETRPVMPKDLLSDITKKGKRSHTENAKTKDPNSKERS